MSVAVAGDRSEVRVGRARGRYFRENFAQGGVDLVQVIPELVTSEQRRLKKSGPLTIWVRETGA